MQRFPDLHALQSIFWRLISAPDGAAHGAVALHREGTLESEDLAFLVRPDARLSAVEHIDIYADMYFYRLRDCLAEDFPKLVAQLGEAHFHNLITDYLLAHPSSHFSLRELGRALPGFLAGHALARELPALADLAAFEWARVDVFDESDATPLSQHLLLEGGAAAPETFRLTLVPATRLLQIDPSVLPLWKRLDAADDTEKKGGAAPGVVDDAKDAGATSISAPRKEPCDVVVWRKEFGVYHRSLPADEARCLEVLSADGATLARLGEITSTHAPPERAGQRLAELLALWTTDELVAAADRSRG